MCFSACQLTVCASCRVLYLKHAVDENGANRNGTAKQDTMNLKRQSTLGVPQAGKPRTKQSNCAFGSAELLVLSIPASTPVLLQVSSFKPPTDVDYGIPAGTSMDLRMKLEDGGGE